MIDTYFIVQYKLSSSIHNQQQHPLFDQITTKQPSSNKLSHIKFTKINLNNQSIDDHKQQQNIIQFNNLYHDLTEKKLLFKKMLQHIINIVYQLMVNFANVTFVAQNINIFTQIIPQQCKLRQLSVPYIMMNFIDIKQIVRKQYQCPFKKLQQITQYLQISTIKQTQTKSKTQLLQHILKKLHHQHKLLSTHYLFIQKCQTIKQKSSTQVNKKYKYYKIIGLPFKSFPLEILGLLAPQVKKQDKEILFIYERQRFSGRGIIKIPQDYQQYLIQKNRMYIGNRYIELELSNEEEFQRTKIKSQKRQDSHSPPRKSHSHKDNYYQKDLYSIGGRRRQSSPSDRSPPRRERQRERERSRQRRDDYYRERSYDNNSSRRNQRNYRESYQPNDDYGIKIRGLPFAFSQWDVQNIFNNYNIIGGTVKLGIKPGTMMKNGQAVILMRSQSDARHSLDMNGYRVMGRYLQVKVITKDQYMKYK